MIRQESTSLSIIYKVTYWSNKHYKFYYISELRPPQKKDHVRSEYGSFIPLYMYLFAQVTYASRPQGLLIASCSPPPSVTVSITKTACTNTAHWDVSWNRSPPWKFSPPYRPLWTEMWVKEGTCFIYVLLQMTICWAISSSWMMRWKIKVLYMD